MYPYKEGFTIFKRNTNNKNIIANVPSLPITFAINKLKMLVNK